MVKSIFSSWVKSRIEISKESGCLRVLAYCACLHRQEQVHLYAFSNSNFPGIKVQGVSQVSNKSSCKVQKHTRTHFKVEW